MSAERRYRSLRRRIPVLAACAAAMAATLAVAPLLAGGGPEPEGRSSFLNRVETGGFDHNRAHLAASPRAKAEAVADAAACEAPGAAGSPFCPAPAPTRAEAAAIRAAGANAGPLGSTQPNGLWGPLLPHPHHGDPRRGAPDEQGPLVLPAEDRPGRGRDDRGRQRPPLGPGDQRHDHRHAARRRVPDGPDRPANLWCGGQVQLADGRVLVVGGNLAYPANGGNVAPATGFKGGALGDDLRPLDRAVDARTRHAPRALVPHPHRAARRAGADRRRLGRDRRRRRRRGPAQPAR